MRPLSLTLLKAVSGRKAHDQPSSLRAVWIGSQGSHFADHGQGTSLLSPWESVVVACIVISARRNADFVTERARPALFFCVSRSRGGASCPGKKKKGERKWTEERGEFASASSQGRAFEGEGRVGARFRRAMRVTTRSQVTALDVRHPGPGFCDVAAIALDHSRCSPEVSFGIGLLH